MRHVSDALVAFNRRIIEDEDEVDDDAVKIARERPASKRERERAETSFLYGPQFVYALPSGVKATGQKVCGLLQELHRSCVHRKHILLNIMSSVRLRLVYFAW